MTFPLIWLIFFVQPPAGPDTLVVCPAEFRAALEPWAEYRSSQGHRLLVIEPPTTAEELREAVRQAAEPGSLRFLVLIGDMRLSNDRPADEQGRLVPTNFLPATVNRRWGSESHIATDFPYSDINGDGMPDLAVGRIPADTAAELSIAVQKILRYERQAAPGPWQQRLSVVAGVGGFGAVADALIEAAAHRVFAETVPQGYDIRQLLANPRSVHFPPPHEFGARAIGGLSEGCLAWIYLGHGLTTELDRIRTAEGEHSILSTADIPRLACGAESPLAVLIACYTGAMDAPDDCLAEAMALCDGGPVAVIAATRVTMPYGNAVFGYELLRACFGGGPVLLGPAIQQAQRRTLADAEGEAGALRTSLDALAAGFVPDRDQLRAERIEHVWMYHLIGDPLLRIQILPRETAAD